MRKLIAALLFVTTNLLLPSAYSLEAVSVQKPKVYSSEPSLPKVKQKNISGRKIRIGFIDGGHPYWDQPLLSTFSHKQITYPGQMESLSSHSTKVISSFILELKSQLPDAENKIEITYCPVDYLGSLDFCLKKMKSKNLDFLNISLAGEQFYPDEKILVSKISRKTIIVAAAGNNGSTKPNYPCAYKISNIVCVGNIDKFGEREPFSNHGDWVNVYEVGTDVSVFSSEAAESEIDTGTSFSSPKHMAKLVVAAHMKKPFNYSESKKEFLKKNLLLIIPPVSQLSQ